MEEWRDVVGYEGYYQVSNIGKVRSLDRVVERSDGVRQRRRARIFPERCNPDGYVIVKLSKDGQSRSVPVHRLVYEAFVDKIPSGMEINHKDFNRKNNSVDNLEAVTHVENIQKTVDAGRNFTAMVDVSGKNNPNYGNRKLSKRYAEDKALSLEKQSRPGARNGRARGIEISGNGEVVSFGCLREGAKHIVERDFKLSHVDYVANKLSVAATSGRPYKGYVVRFL